MKEQILALAQSMYPRIIDLRRRIHAEPELAFEETKTSALVADTLSGLGIQVKTGVSKTGVVGLLEGSQPGVCAAIRADMDALPILEQTGLPFASKHAGVMHACGHDSHTAMALGAAMILAELRGKLHGTVKFLFQPSEEKAPGGAQGMIEEGALKNPDVAAIFGQHVDPHARAGTTGFRPGPLFASADELHITITGKGGHAAKPHLAIDPIVVASHVIIALQSIVSRRVDPFQPCVITIGKFAGGTATNIIPHEVTLAGTMRTLNESLRETLYKYIDETIRGVTRAFDAEYELSIVKGSPAVVNDEAVTAFASAAASELLGKQHVYTAETFMGGEDYAYYLQKVPGTFFRLGVCDPAHKNAADLHDAHFMINERALLNGTATLAYCAATYINNHS